jgi:hypothetical protein
MENLNENNVDNVSRGHRAEVSFEKEIDSLNTVKMNLNLAAMGKNNINYGITDLYRNGQRTTFSDFRNDVTSFGYLINAQGILRKKFKKKGRRVGLNASFLNTSLQEDGTNESDNTFFDAFGVMDSVSLINQLTDSYAVKNQFKVNALFVEPLSKIFFFQTFYNFNARTQNGDRDVLNVKQETQSLDEFLSRTYENNVMVNRWGALLRYSNKGLNISAGAAFQQFNLNGIYTGKGNSGIEGTVDRIFRNWIPNFSINTAPTRNSYLNIDYSVSAQEPSISNLQPIVDNRNPLFIREGNPNLLPSIQHDARIYFNVRKPASSMRFSISANYSYFQNQIIQVQNVDENLVTYSTLTNYTGGRRQSIWTDLSIPILKNKIVLRTNYNLNNGQSFAFVNDVLNKTTTLSHSPSLNLSITPHPNLSLYANARFNWTDTKYDINTSQDQQTTRNNYSLEFNLKTFAGIYFNSNFTYSQYRNARFGFDQDVPILNLSVYRRFLPGDKLETRFSVYDALNQNVNISNFASGNSVTTSETFALAQYFMLSVSYNIRGMKSDVRKDGWW